MNANKMSGPDSDELLSSTSDTSFVILGTGSLPYQENDETLCKNSNTQSVNSKSKNSCLDSFISVSNDDKCLSKCSFSEDSIQVKLNELAKENYHLKETLYQNNLAIKSQLDTLFKWQQEVLKTQESHKQKFLETKDLVIKLRMENLSLKRQLEERFSVISTNEMCSKINNKPEDSDILKERNKEFEKICNEPVGENEKLNIEKMKLGKEFIGAKNEILRFIKELEEVTMKNSLLKQRSKSFQTNLGESISYKSLPNAEARAQISNLFKQLEEEKGKVLELKEALKKTKSDSQEALSSQVSATHELDHCIGKLNDMNHCLDLQNQKISGLYGWVTLEEENQKNEELDGNLRESVEALKKQFTKLLDDYKILQQQLNILHNENKSIEEFKEDIVRLSAELYTKDKELISKQQECSDLKEELKKLNFEWGEKLCVLQIQADLYRDDFNHEREAKEQLSAEKDQLMEQVILFQSHIEELGKSQGNNLHETLNLMSFENKGNYKCPKCYTLFSNKEDFEEHSYFCIDSDT